MPYLSYFSLCSLLYFFLFHLHFRQTPKPVPLKLVNWEIVEFNSLIPAWKSETESERKRVRKIERERETEGQSERERERLSDRSKKSLTANYYWCLSSFSSRIVGSTRWIFNEVQYRTRTTISHSISDSCWRCWI